MSVEDVLAGREPWTVETGDCRAALANVPDNSFDAVLTDPPYEFGFMGKGWDKTGVAFQPETWRVLRQVCKPGAYLLAFGGTRTYHRLTCAIEDGGFEVRDCLMWLYGSGFPKGKGCLKPSWEPIVLARKPGSRVLPLGIDECRVPLVGAEQPYAYPNGPGGSDPNHMWRGREKGNGEVAAHGNAAGRYPANVVHDGSDEVMEAFAAFGESESKRSMRGVGLTASTVYGAGRQDFDTERGHDDIGSIARFFYCAKASREERNDGCHGLSTSANRVNAPRPCEAANFAASHGNHHPTVKPVTLIRWLAQLIVPVDGIVLDPFCGSGTTGVAARQLNRRFVGVELNEEYAVIARRRIASTAPLCDAAIRNAAPAAPREKGLFDDQEGDTPS